MKLDHKPACRLLGFALGGWSLLSCQTSTEPSLPASGPMVAIVQFGVNADRYPDSADWSSSKQAGHGGLACADEVCTDTLKLRDALGAEGAQLRLWSLGIRIATLQLKQEGRSAILVPHSLSKDTFELRLLDDFVAFRKTRSDSFAKLQPLRPSHLVTFYASALLAGKPGYEGFPAKLPIGMKADSVRRALVALGSGRGLSAVKLASLGLGLDSATIRGFAIELFAKGGLSAKDTGTLYPPPVLRVDQPLSVAGDLIPGGEGVALAGSFSWDKGRIVPNPRFVVRTARGIDSQFTTSARHWPSGTDTAWSLTDNVKIFAPRGAIPGMDTLSVALVSDSGHSIEARAVFRVVPRDAEAPVLRITRPGRDTSVPNETYSAVVEAVASDSSGIDSVRIRDKTLRGAPYLDSIFLVTGENQVVAQAWDRFGNTSFDTVRITRAKPVGDTTPPKVVRISPVADTSAPWSTKSIGLSWTVTDDSLLSRVTLDSVVLPGASGLYAAQVPLRVGGNTFVLTAIDAKGNARRDTVRVRRQADTTAPALETVAPVGDTSVSHPVARLRVVVAATDAESGIDSVKIGATRFLAAPFADSIDLSAGTNRISLQAWDKAGNRTQRVLVVVRAASPGDTTAPVITRVRPGRDTTVDWSVKTFELACSIADDTLVSKVWLNDSVWSGTASTYLKSVALSVGSNVFRIAAQDARGNRRSDTVRIVRAADTVKPSLSFLGPTGDSSVAWDVGRIRVSAKASDANGIDSIRIGGRTIGSDAGSDSVSLATGANEIVVLAWDKAGNRAAATLRITRARDTVKPKIVRATGASEQALSYPSSSSISWTVTDNDSLVSVKIQGKVVVGAKDVFTAEIPVQPGRFLVSIVATDRAGNTRSDSVWWTGKLYDSRDRKSYNIGTMPDGKIWMKDDLAFRPASCGSTCIDSFYTWSQAMALPDSCDALPCKLDTTEAIKGACPTGWHIPSGREWTNLVDSAGIVHLKSATDWTTTSNGIVYDSNGDDKYGFNLRPRSPICSAGGCSMAGSWWTTHQVSASNANTLQVGSEAMIASRPKSRAFPLRCIRN